MTKEVRKEKGYVSVDLAYHQCGVIRDMLVSQNITPIDQGKFHCTIAFDKDLIDNALEPKLDPSKVFEAKVIGVELMGKVKEGLQSAVALTLESSDLTEEHYNWMSLGYEHNWPDYIPHMSVAYDVPVEEAERLVDILQPFVGQTFYFNNLTEEPIK
ncbi:hypothetical protein [Photobacterium phage PDCC-1]|uniref:Anti-CBASS protein Acb1 n=1 Tax=Photobacterium phage PDCC-1 TaxID=2664246 RepID=A0A6B9JDX4_9CAUD|nr:RNA ligase [Photobacterium phage PDCC-1]QGZ14466.1 hypothetical protein [Photobacterium phage PDCC-1]